MAFSNAESALLHVLCRMKFTTIELQQVAGAELGYDERETVIHLPYDVPVGPDATNEHLLHQKDYIICESSGIQATLSAATRARFLSSYSSLEISPRA